jgi:hypothetical protein
MRKIVYVGVMLACLLAVSGRAFADSFTVYVAYADNLRASGFFPTPWLGGSGVVSQSSTGQSLDTGAIRIDNTGLAPITITNFQVALGGGQVFNIWSSLTINPGQTGIFTQTASYNFDSSDFGLFGGGPVNVDPTHPLGGCTNPQSPAQVASCLAYQPVISFLENGTGFTGKDAGHILDTFGYDLINLPPPGGDGNESINWTLLGQGGSRGGTTVPEPASLMLLGTGLVGLARAARRHAGR